jgi:hypothetical protein
MSSAASHAAAFSAVPANAATVTQAQARPVAVPWYIWVGVLAVTSASIGGSWDVSWHRTIGRDTFFTPAHMAIYACGLLAGVIDTWLAAKCTFGRDAALRAASVQVLGLRAPLGVFLAGWGGLAMLTSAPFDNWWHNAYGLDVKIISPPHALLILGIRTVALGIMFLILAAMNRAVEAGTSDLRSLRILFLYLSGLAIGGQMFFLQEYTWDVRLHVPTAYIAMAIALPILFATFSQASRFRWAATSAASIYTLFTIAEILILPLFPAQPKLGPVYNPVTHMVPTKFPILILFPALALDLLWHRVRSWKPWQIALVSGFLFVAVLSAVEWPFANFLMSHASQNRFFGTQYTAYFVRSTAPDRMRHFEHVASGLELWKGLASAAVYASISTWAGLGFGRWMRGVQR